MPLPASGYVPGIRLSCLLDECLNDSDTAQALVGWYQANAERDAVRSTPTFMINGTQLESSWATGLIPALDAALGET